VRWVLSLPRLHGDNGTLHLEWTPREDERRAHIA